MRRMSNKTPKGASRDKDKLGVRSRGNSRSKGREPCNQPGSAPRELESGASWDSTRFVHEGVGGWPPAHEPLLKPATPPKATQRQGVIPGRVGAAHRAACQEEQLFSMSSLALRPGLEMSLSQQKWPAPSCGEPTPGTGHHTLHHLC